MKWNEWIISQTKREKQARDLNKAVSEIIIAVGNVLIWSIAAKKEEKIKFSVSRCLKWLGKGLDEVYTLAFVSLVITNSELLTVICFSTWKWEINKR